MEAQRERMSVVCFFPSSVQRRRRNRIRWQLTSDDGYLDVALSCAPQTLRRPPFAFSPKVSPRHRDDAAAAIPERMRTLIR